MENICEWKNCKKIGDFKAPIEKDNSKKFKWLCEDHIKIHNREWDYFKGMSQEDIEFFLKSDSTWHRPTQKFGSLDNFFNILWNNALTDKITMLNGKNSKNFRNGRSLSEKDKEAFKIMGLKYDANWLSIQKTFKTTRELQENIKKNINNGCVNLSMGMSQDYILALKEGATHIRIGSSLFI